MRIRRLESFVLSLAIAIVWPVNGYSTLTDTLCIRNTVADTINTGEKDFWGTAINNEKPISPYKQPYSLTGNSYDWHRLWINTATLSGAFVGTLLVLECLPEDATSWNRAELQDVPLFKRWHNHVIKKGPEWDHDKFSLTISSIPMRAQHTLWLHVPVDLTFGDPLFMGQSYLP